MLALVHLLPDGTSEAGLLSCNPYSSVARQWRSIGMVTPRLHRENMIVLSVIQALCGPMTTDVKAVTIQFPFDDVVVNFLLRHQSND